MPIRDLLRSLVRPAVLAGGRVAAGVYQIVLAAGEERRARRVVVVR